MRIRAGLVIAGAVLVFLNPVMAQQASTTTSTSPNPQAPGSPSATPSSAGPPLFGAPRPDVRPDPNPRLRIKKPTDCPFGYQQPRVLQAIPHLVVCVLKQPYEPEFQRADPGLLIGGQSSPVPTTLERANVNQCLGRPAGSYACGRGGTECCGPNQDNMCFAGSYACYATGSGTGPKKACCMAK